MENEKVWGDVYASFQPCIGMSNEDAREGDIMGKHLLVYDFDWWVLGQKAKMIQHYHQRLDIYSLKEMEALANKRGAQYINDVYEVIATLGLGIAQLLIKRNIRVDTSQIGSYNYFLNNHRVYREWRDPIKVNNRFIKEIMAKPRQFGVINPKLAREVKQLLPKKTVNYIRPFVDSELFCPRSQKKHKDTFVVGWIGNETRKVKNYHTLYRQIVKTFHEDPAIAFVEATRSSPIAIDEMPAFYQQLDLLLITSSNEGGPAPALEAYSSGVPVLATNVGYVKEVAGPKGRSLILNSNRSAPFVQKIKKIRNDPSFHAMLKKEARERILNHYTVEKTMDDWLETLFFQ
ncbi:glycosyltransferase [Salicibibacter cibarius]|uniref:Glycosyltransferase n=1 Tax=Salicibibacter cibarius TaxID=2743000 RepID=A0A7T6Z2X5_9BACI|nr:glycosyltransferase [Salicibibacter cibarius]QQK75702.1 glycosyltransferase [Salicibibacter cibarius]